MPERKLDITTRKYGLFTLIVLGGVVDSVSAHEFDQAVYEQLRKGEINFGVDVKKVTNMTSGGLRVLVSTLKTTRKDGGDVHLCGVAGRMEEVLHLSGLYPIFDKYDDQLGLVMSF